MGEFVPGKVIGSGSDASSFLKGILNGPERDDHLILPPSTRNGYERVKRYIGKLKDPDLRTKTEKLFEEVLNLVIASGGDMDVIEDFSEGGSKESAINKDFVGYVHIKMCGLAILEPIGQINNATYILTDDENLDDYLQNTRDELVDSGIALKLSHESNKDSEYESYNFEGKGILGIVECIVNDKNRFLQMAVPDNKYSSLSRVFRNYQISKLVEGYEITIEDINGMIKQYASEKDMSYLTDKQKEFLSKVGDYLEENHDETDVGTVLADLSAQIEKVKANWKAKKNGIDDDRRE